MSKDNTPFHTTHIELYELAYMLLDQHNGTEAWGTLVNLLVPDVDSELVQLSLGRTAYTAAEEREAETLASLMRRASDLTPQPCRTGEHGWQSVWLARFCPGTGWRPARRCGNGGSRGSPG